MSNPVLVVDELCVNAGAERLVNMVSFELSALSRTGLIGESGSGKSLTALAIMGLLPPGLSATGSIKLHGRELLGTSEKQLVSVRGDDMAMIFQEPMTALNPLHRIGRQVAEPLKIHRGMSSSAAMKRAIELLDQVGIDDADRRAKSFPHELSGGQRQRVMIAAAIACGPDLVIADEPTTALDVTVQQQVLDLLGAEAERNEAALLLITHDLPVVANVADRVMVLRHGELLETGATKQMFSDPHHEYTAQLVSSVPPMARGETLRSATIDRQPAALAPDVMIEVRNVRKQYKLRRTRLLDQRPTLVALNDITLDVRRGETFGIVGESGSGKSTLAKALVGLVPADSGTIVVDGIDATDLDNLGQLRHTAQMVFQDPNGSLDPRLTIGRLISEPLRALDIDGDHTARVRELLEAVSIPATVLDRYPHEFSGGQRQRIAIARALAPNPSVIVADEAVSALDMSVQTITLDLLADLQREFDLTMVFISHDLSIVAEVCDRVAVLEHGTLVELGDAAATFTNPTQPYTQRLVASVPQM